ncbi:OLC1v1025661C3 [Oldenlandia corymbosa var. corymbosa]|uniref:OLC1v1025661C3 n=1 Tax=Oldenlandia corymbosa var. corymbosa TaxID=529605 RepID=A0AAV1C5F2_OLDCO|nr:OLC1v1025661C3 [Oldenlandia corymbosa var. corymbosa]
MEDMVEEMVIDVDEAAKNGETKKTLKRKRGGAGALADPLLNLDAEGKSAKIQSLREELNSLFKFCKELNGRKGNDGSDFSNNNFDVTVAVLMEESGLPLNKLVAEIFEKLKGNGSGGDGVGISSLIGVQNRVLSIGQRVSYGITSADANILEDDSESALWCWETKDMKLLPKSLRPMLKGCRTIRKKIQERVSAISAMIAALEKSESQQNSQELMKASEKLNKLLNETDIRSLVDSMEQNFRDEVAKKEARKDEKLLIKQLEKNRREEEKERKRVERELQKEKLQNEKERKRLQYDAEKEERRREKEESEMKKLLKKQQEELEKDQRRKEKEETEMKKQLSLQKQATLMERFLKGAKTNSCIKNDQPLNKETPVVPQRNKGSLESVTLAMDSVLSTSEGPKEEDIWKLHLNSWRHIGSSVRSNRHAHWSIRRKPKTELMKGLKLSANRGPARDDEMKTEKEVDGWVEAGTGTDSRSCLANTDGMIANTQVYAHRKKLLQFDKSHRPAFYGVMLKKSQVISARNPFVKDPELDYEIDSDEEWEEEEPGESLSDCDKDYKDGDESMDEGCSRGDDDDESEDGFFVPDGYLSENEGVEVDKVDAANLVDEISCSKESTPNEVSSLLVRQQKYLHKLTEHALRKNQPLIILNFGHEKAPLLSADNVTGHENLEQMCLQALCIRTFPDGPQVQISFVNDREDDNACTSNSKASSAASANAPTVSDSDLSEIVCFIQSHSYGINKVVEILHEKFPTNSKSQLRNKVREISDFVDNRWQVKKEILLRLGITISPEKGSGRTKNIATFFSKRCMPPTGKSANPNETSPQTLQKSSASSGQPLEGPTAQEH